VAKTRKIFQNPHKNSLSGKPGKQKSGFLKKIKAILPSLWAVENSLENLD
jgi:hypothetical protein